MASLNSDNVRGYQCKNVVEGILGESRSRIARPGDRDGKRISTKREITLSGLACRTRFTDTWAVWAVAPSF